MLVLSRKVNQVVKIGPDITVRVVRINGDVVRLGFEAPKDTPIVRPDAGPKKDTRLVEEV